MLVVVLIAVLLATSSRDISGNTNTNSTRSSNACFTARTSNSNSGSKNIVVAMIVVVQ